ncbi:hypothetical protein CRENBAI_022884 [Crenichthys baileyi]|uniref:Uncharacterized protein n=1 Tax=Crenichthys baileyi TaxID=28760 RepID=A0AAV9R6C9_9TELE
MSNVEIDGTVFEKGENNDENMLDGWFSLGQDFVSPSRGPWQPVALPLASVKAAELESSQKTLESLITSSETVFPLPERGQLRRRQHRTGRRVKAQGKMRTL